MPFLNDYACEMNNRSNHILNESIARKYQSGDREALKDLIRRFNPQLRSKIYYHTRNKDSVQYISQDCWCVIITKLEEVKFQVGFEAWALNIARNKSIDWIRHQQKERNRKSDSEQEISLVFLMESIPQYGIHARISFYLLNIGHAILRKSYYPKLPCKKNWGLRKMPTL